MQDYKSLSQLIRREADTLLKATELTKLLEQFGTVDLGGSYAYDLMVDRDLDFGVAVHTITPEVRSKIAATFASQSWAYGMHMTDRVNFEPLSNLGAPRGLYLGLTIPFPKERWNIDVWFMTDAPESIDEIAQLIANASQEQKDVILRIKYELMQNGQKHKGATSAAVYKAALKEGVSSTQGFLSLQG